MGKRKLGYEAHARLPTGDGKRYEVLDGELYVTPAPSPLHQRLSKRLQRRLEDCFEIRGLEEAGTLDVLTRVEYAEAVATALITYGEPRAALARHRREGGLTGADLLRAVRELDREWRTYNVVDLSERPS